MKSNSIMLCFFFALIDYNVVIARSLAAMGYCLSWYCSYVNVDSLLYDIDKAFGTQAGTALKTPTKELQASGDRSSKALRWVAPIMSIGQ